MKKKAMAAVLMMSMIMGTIFAWVVSIFFSLTWALLCYAIVATAAGGFVGLLAGIIVFVISFMVHKNYAGISIQGISRNSKEERPYKKIVFWINGLDEIEKVPNQLVDVIRNAIN